MIIGEVGLLVFDVIMYWPNKEIHIKELNTTNKRALASKLNQIPI